MKWILFSFLLLLPILSFSQRGGGLRNLSADSLATLNTNRMKDSLSLSSAQVKRVHQVNLDFETKRKLMLKEAQGHSQDIRQAMRGKMTELRKEHNDALGSLLTADQMNQWKRIQVAIREKRKSERMGRGPRQGKGERAKENEQPQPDGDALKNKIDQQGNI